MSYDREKSLGLIARRLVRPDRNQALHAPPEHRPLSLYVGIVTTNPPLLSPLLQDLAELADDACIKRLAVLVLDNGCPGEGLAAAVMAARALSLDVAVVTVAQQRVDASRGAFGTRLRERPDGQVGIATARTMLQRYVGEMMKFETGSFGWLLDDDMRIDDRARWYLPWLPAFREDGVDVLIGACEGVSPNPPLHGVQCRLFDLLKNLAWLQGLPASAALPDRSVENAAQRARFPDYYYDLSRRHTEHLDVPHWVEPAIEGESVSAARSRLIVEAHGILRGAPFTRPLLVSMPADPRSEAFDSVNRGGHTFVLNYVALTEAPNASLRLGSREARRSDMLWAITNRHYRRMTIKAVAFPAVHVGLAGNAATLDVEKVQDELWGAALYAALVDFLRDKPYHTLDFSVAETHEVGMRTLRHRDRRLEDLSVSMNRIVGIRESLRAVAHGGELNRLIDGLDAWFTSATFSNIRGELISRPAEDVEELVGSLRAIAEEYASAPPPDILALLAHLGLGASK